MIESWSLQTFRTGIKKMEFYHNLQQKEQTFFIDTITIALLVIKHG